MVGSAGRQESCMRVSTLVVDDDPVMSSMIESMLEMWDHDVTVVASGEDGLNHILSAPVDLVVSDIRLPGITGHELMIQAHRELPYIPFILMTGHGSVKDAVTAIQDGAFQYLLKPVDDDRLGEAIERARDARDEREALEHRARLLELVAQLGGVDEVSLDELMERGLDALQDVAGSCVLFCF